jgi:hypothetical protein
MDCFAALAMSKERHTREGGYPVRRGLSLPSLLSLEYWIVRPSAQLRTRRTMTTKYRFAFWQRIAPEVCMNLSPPRKRRVQGMPGARCTRGLVCNVCIEMRTRAYRYSRNTPAFPAQWLCGLCRALLAIERGWLWMHESRTYVKFTQAGAELFA